MRNYAPSDNCSNDGEEIFLGETRQVQRDEDNSSLMSSSLFTPSSMTSSTTSSSPFIATRGGDGGKRGRQQVVRMAVTEMGGESLKVRF
jgi:hypothetical protein